ncbi:hypothetical protein [Sphingomonas sp.]|uniref:hypothetical protein n=1 Tax=Sphingomonas sp. TaxID=28214 RepID=UPI002BB1E762|nr:hypothetical protein [Sphingomonas sp.]HTG38761.1 hypothetical protein [Sphingomonas sp.]
MSGSEASGTPASTLWIMLFTLASTVTTLALACATPFTALAALAATKLRARDGMLLMLAAWVASQVVGFCVLDYPRDASTLGWAIALGTAAIAGLIAARMVAGRLGDRADALRIAGAYVAAALAFKLVILCWSSALGGIDIVLSPSINLRQFVRNGAILLGLYALYHGLRAVGLPAAPQVRALRC